MKVKGTKFVSLFLVFSLVALITPVTAKERRGAELLVQKTDGQQIKGELIAVKNTSLLLVDSDSGADVSIDMKDLKWIKLGKKPSTVKGVE